jgi:glycosyltransferase involved in cell wall biosynthesis
MTRIPENICIATGIYPPEIGGPSVYARELLDALLIQKYKASVVTYGNLKKFPTGLRHILFFLKLVFDAFQCDFIIALDTFSVGLPAVFFSKIFRKKIVLRIGGDFLWESFVERTKEEIKLSDFYKLRRKFSIKEKIIFNLTKFVLHSVDVIVFSTEWQKNIMSESYNLNQYKIKIIENFFPNKFFTEQVRSSDQSQNIIEKSKRVFMSPSRNIFIKNKKRLLEAFKKIKSEYPDVVLDTESVSSEVLREKIVKSYAVVVNSFSEVSPNIVCEAIGSGVPVILTSDNGLSERLANMVLFIDPFSVDDLVANIKYMLDFDVYQSYKKNISLSSYSHSWDEIAQEFINLYGTSV